MVDVLCVGEAMLRRMSDSDDVTIGGAELNVAIALAQFGWDITWLSVLPEDDDGIVSYASKYGVDSLIFRSAGKVGEYTVNVDEKNVEYDRSDSAFAQLDADSIPVRSLLRNTEWIHLTGITPVLGDGPKALWNRLLTFAELDGIKISLDINHRPALCSREELWQMIEPHLRKIHLLSMSSTDLEWICEHNGIKASSEEEMVEAIAKRWLINIVGCTFKGDFEGRRDGYQERWSIIVSHGRIFSTRKDTLVHRPVEHLGSGDAWTASVISGFGFIGSGQTIWPCKRADQIAVIQQSTKGDQLEWDKSKTSQNCKKVIAASGLIKAGVIPILRCESYELAMELAERLIEARAKALEFSLDTPGAANLPVRFADKKEEICIGVGTITDPISQVMKAAQRGARFLFSATNPPEFIKECHHYGVLAVPGVANISEAKKAILQGAKALKLFHAAKNWPKEELLKIREMFPRILLIPVGGLSLEDVEPMLDLGMDAVGLGEAISSATNEELQTLFARFQGD